jgi:hypothetical protein
MAWDITDWPRILLIVLVSLMIVGFVIMGFQQDGFFTAALHDVHSMSTGNLIGSWFLFLVVGWVGLVRMDTAFGLIAAVVCVLFLLPSVVYGMFLHCVALGLLFGIATLINYFVLWCARGRIAQG